MNMEGLVEPRTISPIVKRPACKALEAHYEEVRKLHLKKLFADDSTRGKRLTAEAVGIFLDYSKNRITDETLKLLVQLADESGLRERIDAMFQGEKINITEKRTVLHVALRAPKSTRIAVDGRNVVPKSTLCSTGWPIFLTASEAATGATPASAFEM
jgi:glucose-6-phosphate isomerase